MSSSPLPVSRGLGPIQGEFGAESYHQRAGPFVTLPKLIDNDAQISSHCNRLTRIPRTLSSWNVIAAFPKSTSSLVTVLIDTSHIRLMARSLPCLSTRPLPIAMTKGCGNRRVLGRGRFHQKLLRKFVSVLELIDQK